MNTPNPIHPFETEENDAASERAADFFERRRFGEWSNADQSEFETWLAESTSHYVAFLRVQAIAARADHLAALHARELMRAKPKAERGAKYRKIAVPLLAAASFALMAALAYPYVLSMMQPPDRSYATDVGGHALIKFSDRTQMELNTDTVVRYRMTTQERTVWLEKGEAWFHVAHDADHPFTVIVGRHRVTDLGTEFLIRRGPEGMEVALVSGRAALNTDNAQTTTLTPGDDAVATSASTIVTKKTPQELADELAWRRGVLVFHDAKLADAVREFNRYNRSKLVIADPSIADLRLSVEIQNDNFEDFLKLAQLVLKLRVDREGNTVLLYRGSGEKSKKAVRIKHDE